MDRNFCVKTLTIGQSESRVSRLATSDLKRTKPMLSELSECGLEELRNEMSVQCVARELAIGGPFLFLRSH